MVPNQCHCECFSDDATTNYETHTFDRNARPLQPDNPTAKTSAVTVPVRLLPQVEAQRSEVLTKEPRAARRKVMLSPPHFRFAISLVGLRDIDVQFLVG